MSGVGHGRPVGKMWTLAFGRHDDQTSIHGSAEFALSIENLEERRGASVPTDGPGFVRVGRNAAAVPVAPVVPRPFAIPMPAKQAIVVDWQKRQNTIG
jgi:hypothetical protein